MVPASLPRRSQNSAAPLEIWESRFYGHRPQSRPLSPLIIEVLVLHPTPNLGDLRRQPLSLPGTQVSELSASPPPLGNQISSNPGSQTPPRRPGPAPSTLSAQGPRSPSLPPPPGVPRTGCWRPRPPPSGSRFSSLLTPSLKLRVLEAALVSPWQQESILRWEHTAPAAAPHHPAPPTRG